MDSLKKAAAQAALAYVEAGTIIGVGTGSTANFFIEALATIKHKIEGAVASSALTADKLKKAGIPVVDLNSVDRVPLYIDGTDAVNPHLQLLKGRGGALTREKIIAAAAERFICITDTSKWADLLTTDHTPLAIEVIPMARSYVARQLVKMGATPVYRQGFVSDNGNVILDTYQLSLQEPLKVEYALNNITGVICHGLFAQRPADLLLLAGKEGVQTLRAV